LGVLAYLFFPRINFFEFSSRYLSSINKELQNLVFDAYSNMVAGIQLSQVLKGRRYVKVRDAMLNANLAARSRNYTPLTAPVAAPRLFPQGTFVQFDIYNKKPYVRKGKKYTVQVRFNVWLPFGVLLNEPVPLTLFATFYPIADELFSRVNVDSSLEAMDEAQKVDFTIGIKRRTRSMIRNVDTVTIAITKTETSRVTTYFYDFVVRYQWSFVDLGQGEYEITLCNLRILRARACNSGDDLFELYNETYKEYYGTEYPPEQYYSVINTCNFAWKLYTPPAVRVCNAILSSSLLPH